MLQYSLLAYQTFSVYPIISGSSLQKHISLL